MRAEIEMTTFKRTDGELIHGEWSFSLDVEVCENEASYADEPIEYVQQRWVLVSERRFTLPVCRECDEPATHWGLCEAHARVDDPDHFADALTESREP